MSKLTFIVQARSGSSRLPRKILLPFYKEKTLLDLLIRKLKSFESANIVIATSTNPDDDEIVQIANKHNVVYFRGLEEDVLKRFIEAAHYVEAKRIIRICSDNPFLDMNAIYELIDVVNLSFENLDYVSFWVNGSPSIKTHYGFWTEYVSLSALEKVARQTNAPIYHEHVTNFIYNHPEQFKIKWIKGPDALLCHTNIRLTIDTSVDFYNAQQIYLELIEKTQYPTIENVVKYLDDHQYIYTSMETEILRNSK